MACKPKGSEPWASWELTIWGHQGLVVLRAPPHGVQICYHHVTPEVSPPVLPITTVAQKQQLPTGGDDSGHPVRVRVILIGHFQFHSRLEVALNADFNLKEPKTQETCYYTTHIYPELLKSQHLKVAFLLP